MSLVCLSPDNKTHQARQKNNKSTLLNLKNIMLFLNFYLFSQSRRSSHFQPLSSIYFISGSQACQLTLS